MQFKGIFSGKTVLITGHTGFKGSWLASWLHLLGAKVVGVSLNIPSSPSHFEAAKLGACIEDYRANVADKESIRELIQKIKPDFIFHLAAQSLVRPSYENPLETIHTNAVGTANVLDALRFLKKQVVAIIITSDKVYNNVEWLWGYRETDELGGRDPYSASKGMAELAINSYINSFFSGQEKTVRVGISRAGNVIGGGDWALDRIVPDCIRAWSNKKIVEIRSPNATRPWQHVLEPLSGYLSQAVELYNSPNKHGEAYNFGPPAQQNQSVSALINEMGKYWKNVRWNDVSKSESHFYEAKLLKLNCDKALFDLKWLPVFDFEETVQFTIEWYMAYHEKKIGSMYEFSLEQISDYSKLAEDRSISWAMSS